MIGDLIQMADRFPVSGLRPPMAPFARLDSELRAIQEDDEDVLAVVSENLMGLGYQVVTAVNATQALEFLEGDQPVDVLLSDVIMPGGMRSGSRS